VLRHVEGNPKKLVELVNGTLVEKALGHFESRLALRLVIHLGAFVEEHDLGELVGADGTTRMSDGNVRIPDVGFIVKARLPDDAEKVPAVAPDIAVEVLSDSNRQREIAMKLEEYFASGTRLAWIVDPKSQTVTVYTKPNDHDAVLGLEDTLTGGDVLPAFSMKIAKLFKK